MIRIAPLASEHRARVEAIVRATGVFSDDEVNVALEVVDEALATSADYRLVGAFDGDLVVGYAAYGPTPCCDGTFDLYWIATDPAHQHVGVGTLLLSEVERRIAGDFARMLVVETSSRSDYAPTRGFYGRRGYTEAARVREFYAPDDDRIIFTKQFQQHSPIRRGA
ncbi:MAG: GNAT family N-acetyltransferase [Gemmatimonadaceae bacterium]